jgi:hypothetical protein
MHPTRIFKTPEELKAAWDNYKLSLKDQAKEWPKIQYVGKDGHRMTDYPVLPYTLEGFKRYCRENHGDIHHYFESKEVYYDEFRGICSHVKEEIREQQITGGMLGFYNPSITQRLNGLVEKSETKNEHSGTINANFGNTIQPTPKPEDNT